ncbi:HAD-IIA family hydrolase [Arthrobacter sp. Soil764]|uniref:HAD-IIA family hydrolase n=1 Tax=Arthrobacter sp. Soil764 TaxID=1736403 RepID=UPI00070017C9|nr:HAD-IIA family hydrolase [Arthrobacter sp. Soil764]KRE90046.1 haloacid dehalogenase [Arthrobacter sp. Soil764]
MSDISLVSRFDALLADLDGVVYAGPNAIPGAVESLQQLSGLGIGLGYVTNNASRSPGEVAAHLRELGAPAEDDQVVSSSQAAAELLASLLSPGSRILITGSPALAREIELVGLVPVASQAEDPVAVVQGFSPAIGWKDLAEATYVVSAGALWVATNTDMSIPQARGIAPGNGTLVAAVAAATGQQPRVAGKPEAPLFHSAAKRLGAECPLVVGDRLDTDILGGNNAGFATVAVLTGVDTRETILAARSAERPNYIIGNLTDLHRPYPEVTHDDGTYTCGQSTARVANGSVGIIGSKDHLDSWRAACAAWWAETPDAAAPQAPKLVWLDH